MNKIIFTLFTSLLLLGASCSSPQKKSATQITVTIEPIRYFTEVLVGDLYEVSCMVPKGASPETYDPTPQQLIDLTHSQALFYTGYLGFEQLWIDRLQNNAPETRFFNLSKQIDLIHEGVMEHHGHQHLGGIEPHLWNSPKNALVLIENIYNALCSLDSTHIEHYKLNYEKEKQRIIETDQKIKSILSQPGTSKSFMIYHPALTYFAQAYNLTQLSIEEEGKEPSPSQLKKLLDQATEYQVKIIFIQPEFDIKNAKMIANEIGAKIVPINPLSYNWHEEMINVAKALN